MSLAKSIAKSMLDSSFLTAMKSSLGKVESGDFEYGLTRFLEKDIVNTGLKSSGQKSSHATIMAMIIDNSFGELTEEGLEKYLLHRPNLILALRGKIDVFFQDPLASVVYATPSDFDEMTETIEAIPVSVGNSAITQIDLTDLKVPIIAIQEGERYVNGLPIKEAKINIDEPDGGFVPPFTTCPVNTMILNSFSARLVNNRVLISYDVDTPDNSIITIKIDRLDPGATNFNTISNRTSSDDRSFYDQDQLFGTNIEYIYRLTATITSEDSNGNSVTCEGLTSDGLNSRLLMSVAVNVEFPRLSSFVGEHVNRHSISYTWYPLPNVSIDEYRLSVFNNGQYEQVTIIPTSSNQANQFTFDHGIEKRGELIKMQIQYRSAGGPWLGDFYDESYASFRQRNWPFRYYGVKMNDQVFAAHEIGENPIFGFPEIRVVVAQALVPDSESLPTLRETVVFTTNSCLFEYQRIARDEGINVAVRHYVDCLNGDEVTYYVPTASRFGFPLIGMWDGDLVGSNLNVISTETDAHQIRVTEETISQGREVNLKGDFGFKLPIPIIGEVTTAIGVSTKWTNTRTRKLVYPGDLTINRFSTRYHHPLRVDVGNEVYGYGIVIGDTHPIFGDLTLDRIFMEHTNGRMLRGN